MIELAILAFIIILVIVIVLFVHYQGNWQVQLNQAISKRRTLREALEHLAHVPPDHLVQHIKDLLEALDELDALGWTIINIDQILRRRGFLG